jgi:excisionase family DNA binding protein
MPLEVVVNNLWGHCFMYDVLCERWQGKVTTLRECGASAQADAVEMCIRELQDATGGTIQVAPTSIPAAPLLTAHDVSERLNLPLQRVWELIRQGKLPAIKVGRQKRIAPAVLERWIADGGCP